ncbi:MAG: DUF4174 domain-containing protein [Bacteroidota bacterium]
MRILNILLLSLVPGMMAGQHLQELTWKNRVLIVHVQEASPEWPAQQNLWRSNADGMAERDLVVGIIQGDTVYWPDCKELARPYLDQFRISSEEFCVLLIGKDGGEKLRTGTVLPVEKLYAVIDAMPMRRQEMRRKD